LKAKVTELNDKIARMKVESSEAQERAKKSRLDTKTREGDLHQRLQSSLDALRGEFSIFVWINFLRRTVLLLTWWFVLSCSCCRIGRRSHEGARWDRI
jgi:hypothetical protein